MSARPAETLIAIQAGLKSAFQADAALAALVFGRIHDGTPRAGVLPYLAFTDARGRDWGGGESLGTRASLTLEAVAGDGERGRVMKILDAASERILAASLTVPGGSAVLVQVTDTAVERAKDGRTWRGRLVVDVLVDA